MFDHIHSSTESNDTLSIPAAQAMPIPASPHRFPTPARCWPRSECRAHAIREVLGSRTYTGADG